jgi:hypothetical protein
MVRTTTTVHKLSGSAGVRFATRNMASGRMTNKAIANPTMATGRDERDGIAKHHPRDIGARCTDRQPDANLLRLAFD